MANCTSCIFWLRKSLRCYFYQRRNVPLGDALSLVAEHSRSMVAEHSRSMVAEHSRSMVAEHSRSMSKCTQHHILPVAFLTASAEKIPLLRLIKKPPRNFPRRKHELSKQLLILQVTIQIQLFSILNWYYSFAL